MRQAVPGFVARDRAADIGSGREPTSSTVCAHPGRSRRTRAPGSGRHSRAVVREAMMLAAQITRHNPSTSPAARSCNAGRDRHQRRHGIPEPQPHDSAPYPCHCRGQNRGRDRCHCQDHNRDAQGGPNLALFEFRPARLRAPPKCPERSPVTAKAEMRGG